MARRHEIELADDGERSAYAMLDKAGVTAKPTKEGIRLRYGERGHLTTPEPSLVEAIETLIAEGPITKVAGTMLELHLAAALAYVEEPEEYLFPLLDECLDIAVWMSSREKDTTPTVPALKVLPFPVLEGDPHDD